ncbi:2,3,4,5-tetrahydropyridine-2,6-dicarboxylate N-acetyltransferase [uncultured archaeon]|nr:2,3,4,5-tetrahydropyridine-2,6-dicarboxylate N-acetyltransferase [uncultured archaeon]
MAQERFSNWQPPVFDERGMTKWMWMCQHRQNLKLGPLCDIGAFTYINAKEGVEIGERAQIGSHCSIYSVSTIDEKKGRVVIGKNARVGSHSVIMPGVSIGENAVVGAMSFVNADIPAGSVAVGCPARVIKKN